MKPKLIVLLTDFGLSDPYVGIMKGVISAIDPELKTIDLTHLISPGDIQSGAFHLWQASPYFPDGTVFLAVVDPGVGTKRRGLFLQAGEHIYIGPDNGLFTYLDYKTDTQAWELANSTLQLENSSSTFHGRDIFAPAAAHAARGMKGESFGKAVTHLEQLPHPLLVVEERTIQGEVISTDQFGNLITSLGQFQRRERDLKFTSWIDSKYLLLPKSPVLTIGTTGTTLPLVSTFSDIPAGNCAVLIGSSGLFEIVSNRASAAEMLGLVRGDRVSINLE